ncbi:MAG: recombinase family protein [Rhizobiaceae bacterium]|nr:recombinase family protein [Rhizobiaceae bacterium]
MKRIAYLRVSTAEQRPDRQIDGLKEISDELHIEILSAVAARRPVYEQVIASLEPGDKLVVWSLDRAFRCARDALNEAHALRERGVHFHIADLQLDTTTPHGKLIFTVMSGIAEFERDLLIKRTKEGIEAARARGKRIGRPPKMTAGQIREARRRIETEKESPAKVAADYGVVPWTLARALKRNTEQMPC